jgi:hypothetical protein
MVPQDMAGLAALLAEARAHAAAAEVRVPKQHARRVLKVADHAARVALGEPLPAPRRRPAEALRIAAE